MHQHVDVLESGWVDRAGKKHSGGKRTFVALDASREAQLEREADSSRKVSVRQCSGACLGSRVSR